MNRKHNQWVSLSALILLLAMVVCVCASCYNSPEAEMEAKP